MDESLIAAFAQGQCPDCGSLTFYPGLRGNAAINVTCAGCGARFNVGGLRQTGVVFAERLPGGRIHLASEACTLPALLPDLPTARA